MADVEMLCQLEDKQKGGHRSNVTIEGRANIAEAKEIMQLRKHEQETIKNLDRTDLARCLKMKEKAGLPSCNTRTNGISN